jgi:diguanylate cyclase (GGDEF)-like protein
MVPGSANFRAGLRSTSRRNFFRLGRSLCLGIAGRLAVSFAAVAILAAAANLFIEHSVAVVHTTRLERGLFSPLPAPIIPQETTNKRRTEPPAPAVVPAVAPAIKSDRFIGTVDRFQRAAQARESVDSAITSDELQAATGDLESAANEIPIGSAPLAAAAARAFSQELSGYIATGGGYVQIADSRRIALREYANLLDSMGTRISASLDRGWKIFGRVIARQSLMQLHSDLEELRRRFAGIGASDGYDVGTIESIASTELAVAATFNRYEGGLKRSEGADWVHWMREDLSQIELLRASIVNADSQSRDSAKQFADARVQLIGAIPKIPPKPLVRAAPETPAVDEPVTAASAVQSPAPLSPAIASPIADAVITTTVPVEHARRITIAAITAAVLSVLLMISVLTVRSILVPVSRMLAATKKLAGGDVDVRVPRGGIKELDTLAVAFNRMAAQLAAARDMTQNYRQHLETQVEQRTRQLQYLAEHDPLTLLPNRRHFFALLSESLQRAAECGTSVVVFFIDIDNFKNLNDSMGHAFGDRVLVSVAQRLQDTAGTSGFAARLGGDEFTVVYEDASPTRIAHEAGRRLVNAFQQSLTVDGRDVSVSVSVGASLYPDHELRPEELLSAADAALFRAKALGRSQLAIYTPELLEAATRKFNTEQGVRRALEHDEFELVFQPEASLQNLEVALVEALLRWRLPDGRRATPDEFLGVAEESGLIVELGNRVLRKAIEIASIWHHGLWPGVRIAINVSARQLRDQRFVDRVQTLLKEYKLPPHCIEFELTESVLQTGPATIESLRHLRSLDISIALDDFGTGYSSLASLEQLPLSRIKLDRTLIANIDTNVRSAAVTAALIKLCDGLGLEVTAEGVERPAQFCCLADNRSMCVQGYLIARPVAAEDVLRVKGAIPQIMQDLLLSIPAANSKIEKLDPNRRRTFAS